MTITEKIKKFYEDLRQSYQEGRSVAINDKMNDSASYHNLDIFVKMPELPKWVQGKIMSNFIIDYTDLSKQICETHNKKRSFLESAVYNFGHSSVQLK
ncbi:MAG: hypothetical protein AABW50_04510 [Nanoarchaeota archaeon]